MFENIWLQVFVGVVGLHLVLSLLKRRELDPKPCHQRRLYLVLMPLVIPLFLAGIIGHIVQGNYGMACATLPWLVSFVMVLLKVLRLYSAGTSCRGVGDAG